MKKYFFLFLILVCASAIAEAKKQSKEEILQVSLDSCRNVIKELQDSIKILDNTISTLKEQNDKYLSMISGKVDADPEVQSLKDSVALLNGQLETYRRQQEEFDMVRLRYANGRLDLPYNKEKVDEALKLFNEISDQDLKKQYAVVGQLLTQYPSEIDPVRNLIQSLQDSRQDKKFNKFNEGPFNQWKNKALSEIENNSFYKSQSKQAYKILFLYNIIEEAKKRIKGSTFDNLADFSDLLIRLDSK